MDLTARFDAALAAASFLHNGQYRKGTSVPYISHLLAVAAIVLEHGGNEDEAIAALLHDAVEDQGGQETLARIERSFGPLVAGIVAANSDADTIPKPPWRERKTAYLRHIRNASCSARLVSCADKLHNIRSILAEFDALETGRWAKFNASREDIVWYYGCLAEAFAAAGESALTGEFDAEVRELERLAGVARDVDRCPPDSRGAAPGAARRAAKRPTPRPR
ncbi:MAG: HD domain-containing protein [Chloroflexota bacterium]